MTFESNESKVLTLEDLIKSEIEEQSSNWVPNFNLSQPELEPELIYHEIRSGVY
jgi:hypothetical protein